MIDCRGKYGTAETERLFQENQIDCCDEAEECCEVVPVELFTLEHDTCNDREDGKRDDFLYHLQLHECIWSAIADETNLVGRNLQRIFEKGYQP